MGLLVIWMVGMEVFAGVLLGSGLAACGRELAVCKLRVAVMGRLVRVIGLGSCVRTSIALTVSCDKFVFPLGGKGIVGLLGITWVGCVGLPHISCVGREVSWILVVGVEELKGS